MRRPGVAGAIAMAALATAACDSAVGGLGASPPTVVSEPTIVTSPTASPAAPSPTAVTASPSIAVTSAASSERPATSTAWPTATAAGGFEPPQQIDVAYVQRVLDALDEAFTPGLQAASDRGAVGPQLLERMDALWTADWRERMQPLFADDLVGTPDLIADEVDTRYHEITELVVAERHCIVVRATVDFGAWLDDGEDSPPPGQFVTVLVPRTNEPDLAGVNPTGWVVAYDTEPDDEVPDESRCSR